MRAVFFGTPDFAVPSLRALLRAGYDVRAVVTQPDRPHGRSRSRLVPPPVKVAAETAGLPVLQPEKPVGDEFVAALRAYEPEIGIVVAYGHILRPAVLGLPPRGMLNVHASLLPRWRGAAPIQWAMLAGDAVTGVSIMQMEVGLDSGPVYRMAETPIAGAETGPELTARLAELGAHELVAALGDIAAGRAAATPQDAARVTYAHKIDRATTRLRWDEPTALVARRIRAFDPAPGAWTTLGADEVKLFGATPADGGGVPGTILGTRHGLVVATGDGAVTVSAVQPAGKARLGAADWARGRPGLEGQQLA